MGDRQRGQEKPVYEAEAFPSAESLLGRLNQIDLRLRQLEQKERLPEIHFTADLKERSKQLPSAMDDVHLKDALMDRLNMLETRIRQLSHELDKGDSSSCHGEGCASSNSMMAIRSPAKKQKQMLYSCSRRELGGPCRAGADNFQSQMPKKKAMEPMQAATTEAMDKRAAAFCRNEKRRTDRSRLCTRWFHVGC